MSNKAVLIFRILNSGTALLPEFELVTGLTQFVENELMVGRGLKMKNDVRLYN